MAQVVDVLQREGAMKYTTVVAACASDPATQQFKVRDIMIVKDLHCWELRYQYSDFRKEFSFAFSLKALPDEPVGISPGRGFYFEGFEKTMDEFRKEGAIRRY